MDRRKFLTSSALGSAGVFSASRLGRGAESGGPAEKSACLERAGEVIAAGPFADTWESLSGYRVPEWYADAKLGIFIHWGVYSVPAYGSEWYPRNMYLRNHPEYWHHRRKWGPQNKFGYKDFIPLFKAEHFDAGEWIKLFQAAGARYVVPVAEHHDGFAMYDCGFSEWTAAKIGPKRDVLGELKAAADQAGLIFGASSHRAEHWWFFEGGRNFNSDVNDPRFESFYGPARAQNTQPDRAFLEDWLARTIRTEDSLFFAQKYPTISTS